MRIWKRLTLLLLAAARDRRLAASIGIIVALLGPACTPASEPPAPTPAPRATGPASAPGLTSVVGQAPRGAIITLEPTIPRESPLPDGVAVMDQYSKQFVPSLLMVRVGQPVEFRNSEDTPHNVHVMRSRTGTAIFDVSTDSYQKHTHTFDRPGQYEVSCDIHPGMMATVVATSTPYAAVANDQGAFAILDVPPGSYKVTASSAGRDTERTVEVSGPRTEISLVNP